jgi:ubiquinone/menaquinone biosynthesis C-methylase UbiE
MAEKFDPAHAHKLEQPERLTEMPPAKLTGLMNLSGDETLIDFGAGTGMYSLPLSDAVPRGRVYAVDEQPQLLDHLRAKLAAQPRPNLEPVVVKDGRVPLDDGIAQGMLIINVLHHIADDPHALAEIPRLMAPGGILVLAEFAKMERPVGPPNDHLLSLDETRALLTGAGLREVAAYEPGIIGLYHDVLVAEKPLS